MSKPLVCLSRKRCSNDNCVPSLLKEATRPAPKKLVHFISKYGGPKEAGQWIISSMLFGVCLCISSTDEQDRKPQPLPKTHGLARLAAFLATQ